jgi:crotonobetainyl-CoA:carnitine CoA-transferase CaiB-like acyl-CoA transferase
MAEQLGHREGPIWMGLPIASIGAAYLAAIATLGALYRRAADGQPRFVETSLLDGALAGMSMYWGDSETDPQAHREGTTAIRSTGVPAKGRLVAGAFRCSDGLYIGIATSAVGAFGRLMTVLGLDHHFPPDTTGREIFVLLTPEQKRVVQEDVPTVFLTETCAEWERRLVEADVCGIPWLPPTEVFDDPQARWNGAIISVDDPQLGTIEQPGRQITFGGRTGLAVVPAPRHAEHDAEIRAELAAPRTPFLVGDGPVDDRALLADLKILDLGAYLAGPYSSRLLADLGAVVAKVETPQGDPLRGVPRMYRAAQAGKRSTAIDLKDPRSKDLLTYLVGGADAVHHNMRPGVAERLGVDDASLRAIRPDLVYGYAPGWGSSGPSGARQSLEPHQSGHCGCSHEVAGQFNEPLYSICNSDAGNGMLGAVGMLTALLARKRTGQGQHYENSHIGASLMIVSHIARTPEGEVVGGGRLDVMQLGLGPLERLYETADGWVCLTAVTDAVIAAVERAVGVDLLGDEKFDTVDAREVNADELADRLGAAIAAHPTAGMLAAAVQQRAPIVEPVPFHNITFMRDPANQASGRVSESVHPTFGLVREVAHLIRTAGLRRVEHRVAPTVGDTTIATLRDAGYAEERIAELLDSGAAVDASRVERAVAGSGA